MGPTLGSAAQGYVTKGISEADGHMLKRVKWGVGCLPACLPAWHSDPEGDWTDFTGQWLKRLGFGQKKTLECQSLPYDFCRGRVQTAHPSLQRGWAPIPGISLTQTQTHGHTLTHTHTPPTVDEGWLASICPAILFAFWSLLWKGFQMPNICGLFLIKQ